MLCICRGDSEIAGVATESDEWEKLEIGKRWSEWGAKLYITSGRKKGKAIRDPDLDATVNSEAQRETSGDGSCRGYYTALEESCDTWR